jgi:hypothetical protein
MSSKENTMLAYFQSNGELYLYFEEKGSNGSKAAQRQVE